MVTKIDRCSRNTLEFLKLQGILFKRNTTFVALDLPNSIDLVLISYCYTLLGTEFENARRKERQKQGIELLKKKANIKDAKL